jgi:hypothetical protein
LHYHNVAYRENMTNIENFTIVSPYPRGDLLRYRSESESESENG